MTTASCGRTATLARVRRLLFLLLFSTVALASCGGGEDQDDVEGLLDRAFSGGIESADLKLDAELRLEGSPSLERPVRLQASGPFISNEDKLPSADIEIKLGSDGGGQTVTTGVLLTGDRAFVKFQDVYYEQPRAQVRRANRALRQNRSRDGSLSELGFDPRGWLADAQDEGEADVAGVETRHVSGTLDVESVLRDFNRFVRRSGQAIGGATGQAPPAPLSGAQIRSITNAVEDPSFDVYTGKKDGLVRRVSGRVEFKLPESSRADVGGIEGGAIEFSLELADVNGDQEIEPPAKARPISALIRSLGGQSVLEGLGSGIESGSGDGLGESAPEIEPPSDGDPDQGKGQLPPESTTTPEAEDFREYADCLDEARPEDTEALQRCAELLERP
jgi:hypothetical protein